MRPFLFAGGKISPVPCHCRTSEDIRAVQGAFVAASRLLHKHPQYGPWALQFFRVAWG